MATTPDRKKVFAWTLWDAGNASFNAIMTTFIFTALYLTSSTFGSETHTTAVMSTGLTIAGLFIALLAPISGQRADATGKRGFWLGANTFATAALMALCFFVLPDPSFLWFGVALIALANIVNEFSIVNYNALLPGISTPASVGKISGLGWAFGYFGGIVALVIVMVLFINPGVLPLPEDDPSLTYRLIAVFSALWCVALSLPLLLSLRGQQQPVQATATESGGVAGIVRAYKQLFATIARIYRSTPSTLYFLVTSAIFRDGLNGVFTFGGILAAGSFGFSAGEIIVFAIAGNIVAGVGALIGGLLDDRLGPKTVIMASLVGVLVAATPLLFIEGKNIFWLCGLALCAFVGPAQSAARTYLARVSPAGEEGELFGLYSTTGRAASFLAPALFGFFVTLMGAQTWGILGIMVVVGVGLLLVIPLKPAPKLHTSQQLGAENTIVESH
ncbi:MULTISPECIES: MFS transporter [unclassified Rothia (in: high G+C Gram-positive bacteria)]|uniref:MFS transporter n=1 Tax=unclassified Rothia (in: high G+C Gram-positive bacteria) TaxID=2689056 RepID=UPI00195CE0FD|nr:MULTISPECIES: MFS transporter [unclassified Rothia (in: high G+C Gram-positive bacteria)]MBM7051517.1 MFS transporter [Rothia sp. ZJ1223]QRZ61299.1 MFS transporter [Rothia sp. ZJ932]